MYTHENLRGRTAVITGGSGVLCSAMAKELAKQGVRVALVNRTIEKGQVIADEIRALGGEAVAYSADVLDRASLEAVRDQVISAFGQVDILITGAGGNQPAATTTNEVFGEGDATQTFFDMDALAFSKVFDLNFTGTFLTSQVFGKELLKSKNPVILNISSMSAYSPMTKVPAYSAAKASINNFTMWMAVHFAEAGLRVNALAPGFFLTEQNRKLLTHEDGSLTDRSHKIMTHTPMRRFGNPEDLIGTMLWLVDESYSGFVTGVTVPVDGGFMAYSGV